MFTAVNPTFREILSDLEALQNQIELTLPASPPQMQRQTQQFPEIQEKLRINRQNLTVLSRRSPHSSDHPNYRLAVRVIEDMIRYVDALEHLAAEHPIDPAGTITCLSSIRKSRKKWVRELKRLRARTLATDRRRSWLTFLGLHFND